MHRFCKDTSVWVSLDKNDTKNADKNDWHMDKISVNSWNMKSWTCYKAGLQHKNQVLDENNIIFRKPSLSFSSKLSPTQIKLKKPNIFHDCINKNYHKIS